MNQTKQAVGNLNSLIAIGAALGVVGGIVLATAWPGTEIDIITGRAMDTGSGFWTVVGALVAWVGNALLFVGLTGWGVKVGREASPTRLHESA